MRSTHGIVLLAMASALALAASAPLTAQEEADPGISPACQAEAMTPALPAGVRAAPVTFELTPPIGEITAVQVFETDAHIPLADPRDLPRAAMVAENVDASPIEMSNEDRRVTLWLNTEGVEPGTYEILLRGVDGDCSALLEVGEPG